MALSVEDLSRMIRDGKPVDLAKIEADIEAGDEVADGVEKAGYMPAATADGKPDPYSYMQGWSLITAAAHRGNASIVDLLKQLGANPLQPVSASNPLTAMILAAEKGHVDVIKVLGNEGNPNLVVDGHNAVTKAMQGALGYNSESPLTPAAFRATLSALQEAGAKLELPALGEGHFHNMLTYALYFDPASDKAKAEAVLAIWRDMKGSMALPTVGNATLLTRSMFNHDPLFSKIAKAGFGLDQSDHCGLYPVHYAINNCFVAEVKALLEAGADPQVMTPSWHFANDPEGVVSKPMTLEELVEKDENKTIKPIPKRAILKAISEARGHAYSALDLMSAARAAGVPIVGDDGAMGGAGVPQPQTVTPILTAEAVAKAAAEEASWKTVQHHKKGKDRGHHSDGPSSGPK